MKMRIALLVIVLCLFTLSCLAAPAAESQISIFPGSGRDDARGAALDVDNGDVLLMATNGMPLERLSHTVKSYFTSASIEAVTAFYWKALNATDDGKNPRHPAYMSPGGSSKVDGELTGYEPIRDIYKGEQKVQTAAQIKGILAAHRQPSPLNGQWLRSSSIYWNAKLADGKYAIFVIAITDISFDEYYQSYQPQTVINIAVNIFEPEDEDALPDEPED